MARIEFLQARVETLEHQIEALMVTPRAHSSLLPERREEVSPPSREPYLPRDPPESHQPAPQADGGERREVFRTETPAEEPAPRAVFARRFQPASPEIGLLVSAGDQAGRRVAETLTGILAGAGWTVRGVTEKSTALGCTGLTLAAAPTLPLQRITSTLNALREAGFAMAFQLDPEREASETVLIVGTGAGVEHDSGVKS